MKGSGDRWGGGGVEIQGWRGSGDRWGEREWREMG